MKGGSVTKTITVTINGNTDNEPPTILTAPSDVAVQHADAVSKDLSVTYTDTEDSYSDLILSYSYEGKDASGGTLADPDSLAGLTLSSEGALSGTATLTDKLTAETHTIRATVEDSDGAAANTSFNLHVGLNISDGSHGLENGEAYDFTGSDVAEDWVRIDQATQNDSSGPLGITGLALGGSSIVDLGDGKNTFRAGIDTAQSGSLSYTGGDGDDYISFAADAARARGAITIEAGDGANTLYLGVDAAQEEGEISYTGGTGVDTFTILTRVADEGGEVTLDLGADSAADIVEFYGEVAPGGGSVIIQNFDAISEDKIILRSVDATGDVAIAETNGDLIVTHSGEDNTFVEFILEGVSSSDINLSMSGSYLEIS